MQWLRGSTVSRARCFAAFAFLLFATTALPLFGASLAEGSEESPPAEELPAPDFTEIELEELEHAEWLSSPEAVSQREASRTAYTNLSADEAQGLLMEAFPQQLQELNADPARFLSDLEIDEPLGTYGARISLGEGESALVESAVPVESDLGGEGKELVDLALEESGDNFVPQNPLTEVELPGSAEAPIQLQSGVEVALPTSDDHGAEPLGDKNLFYPETDAATDTLVSPVAGGVEVFEQLRSPESPEQFNFMLGLPEGALLRSSEEGGGAEVVSSSEDVIEEVPPPSAVDAQGAEVPVEMSVEGDSLVLEVPHRLRDVAYPLLVDPKFDSPSFGSGEWHPSTTASYTLTNNGSSLSAVSKGNVNYPANTYGHWVYTAPGETTYIEAATFSSVYFFVNGCFTAEPHGYTGLYNVNSKKYVGLGRYSGGYGYSPSVTTGPVGGLETRNAVIGIGTAPNAGIKLTCAHELYVGGVTAQENDPEPPTINSVSGIPSSGWFDPATAGNATIAASDPGFGVYEIRVFDGKGTSRHPLGCSGLAGSRCPRNANWTVAPPYAEGERTLVVTAEDITEKVGSWTRTTKVDFTKPEIDLSGQLAVVTQEQGDDKEAEERPQSAGEDELSLPVYNLHVEATDGKEKGGPPEKQSGIKNIEIFLDGVKKEVPWNAQSCPSSSCKMEVNYQMKLLGIPAGEHKLEVKAIDQLNHARVREIYFEYIPATGIKDEYVMQRFSLSGGEGVESEEENSKGPELAVNVMNGNLVYHQRDVEVSSPEVDLELERFYNSQLPEADNTEWGDGWTLAQTPKLELEEEKKEEAPPQRASMVRASGALARAVTLPTELQVKHFSTKLQAVVTKEPDGGYEIADQSGETATSLSFNETGDVTELLTPGYAKINYTYEDDALSEVAVHDPSRLRTVPPKESKAPAEFEAPAFANSFGGEGSGPGRLAGPNGIATDPDGNVWVADTGHNRIQEFSPKGEFLSQFGIGGNEDGEFFEPRAVAVDPNGDIWVADRVQSRVQEFNAKGEFIRGFGGYGTANGKFTSLQGIAVDSEGHIWTIDGNKTKPRVQKFSSTGTYLAQFGAVGSEDGQLKEPQGIAIDAQGDVWVADTANNRIQEFNQGGGFIRKFGTEGTGNGQLKSPSALALDPEGNVWVTDAGNNRIQEFSAEGSYLSQYGTAGNDSGQFSEPRGIAIDSSGHIWTADTANNRVQELTTSEFIRRFGGEGSEAGQLSSPADIATDPQGNVWVADTGHNRIQEFNSKGEFIRQFGAKGSAPGLFSSPHGIATDPEGNVWVADTGNWRIQEFNSKGEFIRQFGSKGTGNGKFIEVWDVAIDPAGHVWTVDASATISRVQEFNSKGEYIRKFGSFGTGYTQFRYPKGIAADPSGHIWVADSNNNRIVEYTPDGKVIRMLEGHGAGNGQVEYPAGITSDSEGNIWIADTENNRVQQLSPEGTYLGQFGTAGNEDGQLSSPQGIAIDPGGNVWIADTRNDRVQEVAASEFVRKFGGSGTGAGQLSHPNDIAADSEGNVWIADTWHNRIQEFNHHGEFVRQVGSFGSGDGLFSSPLGVAVDAKDNVWIADGSQFVQEFNSKGEFIRRFGGIGKESGQFSSLQDVAVDPAGHVWTVEANPPRVQEFSADGEPLSQFGSQGSGNGQLYEPDGIATDLEGNIWIVDTGNHRIQEFSATGGFIRKFGGFGFSNGRFNYPSGIAVDSKGIVWIADSANNRVQAFTTEGTYLGRFGTVGNNEGQLYEPRGVAADSEGNVWVADTWNERVEKWQIPQYVFKHSSIYLSSFASGGSDGGEFEHPGDVALGPGGNLWVADEENNRIEEFNKDGEFVAAFGKDVNKTEVEASGSEAEKNLCTAISGDTCQAGKVGNSNGQLNRPASLAIDADGDIWVADKGNSRIQEFDEDGKYLSKFGSPGSGNGQFHEPEGIAIAPNGHVWVADTYNGRIQEFDEAGQFVKVVGSYGSDPGEIGEPTGIDIGPGGNVWVADWQNNRIEEFNSKGEFIRQFGTQGTGNGQFQRPDNLVIDSRGQLWVTDEGNGRIQAFTEKGEYVAKLGTKGSGDGQFSFGYPGGIETDSKGNLWVADSENNRVQQWGVFNFIPAGEAAVAEDGPRVEVSTSGGLVDSVEGEEAGQIDYEHEGELLSGVEAPAGETAYEYDEEERLTKVTLPNGTWGEVQYDSMGRVKSITVSIEGGAAKTTNFAYFNEPRETVVTFEDQPAVTYEIGADGSVLKWRNAKVPPEIEELTGSLYYERGEVHPEPISPGDQTLLVKAHSWEGIASIQIVANGDQIVAEKNCEASKCVALEKELVTETENWPPGILQFEVIVTDTLGQASSERFWDNIPYTPPPDPETPVRATFAKIKEYRSSHGLDLDLNPTTQEQTLNERIFSLIGAWDNPSTPEGRVARFAAEQWGVPMRLQDVEEMEYREWYIATNTPRIEEWGEAHSSTYAGFVVDHAAGGIIRVGFTEDASTRLTELKQQESLVVQDRLTFYTAAQGRSLASLKHLMGELTGASENNGTLESSVLSLSINTGDGVVRVGASNTAQVEAVLHSLFGNSAPVAVEYEPKGMNLSGDRIKAGENLRTRRYDWQYQNTEFVTCTAGYGAFKKVKQPSGQWTKVNFLLTAGHCSETGAPVQKFKYPRGTDNYFGIGHVATTSWPGGRKWETDALAVKLEGIASPRYIYWPGSPPRRVTDVGRAHPGDELCFSGVTTGRVECGSAIGTQVIPAEETHGIHHGKRWVIAISVNCQGGDSGAPVWNKTTGFVVGLLVSKAESLNFPDFWHTTTVCSATPLLHPKGTPSDQAPGVFYGDSQEFQGLHLEEAP